MIKGSGYKETGKLTHEERVLLACNSCAYCYVTLENRHPKVSRIPKLYLNCDISFVDIIDEKENGSYVCRYFQQKKGRDVVWR